MPPKDSATEMLYKILNNATGIGVTYDAKTNTFTYDEPKIAIYDKITAVDKCYASCATDHKCSQCENWKEKEEETKMKNDAKPVPVYSPFAIRSVLSNRKKNAFSVVWMDGTTTVVHCQYGDEWDDEKALAMCFTKKALGNKGNFNDKFNDALDNKMKVIPMEKKTIPAREACDCDGTCTECKCGITNATGGSIGSFNIEKDSIEKAAEAAETAGSSLKEMINTLTGAVSKNDKNESKKTKEYRIFVCSAVTGEKKRHIATCHSVQEVRDFVKEYSKEASYGWYFRTWNSLGLGMYIDYGSYANYLLVEGMDNSEYVKK
jgi:hypothetical protein